MCQIFICDYVVTNIVDYRVESVKIVFNYCCVYDQFLIKKGARIIEIIQILKKIIKTYLTILILKTIFHYFREFTVTILVALNK